MEELILSEFYNKILIEATGGVIDIDGFKFNIEFQTRNGSSRYLNENVFETLEIKNKELFDKLLDKIDNDISVFLLKAEIRQNTEMKQTIKGSANDGKEKIKSTPKKVTKIGRNDPCPCGSGKKYKNCCGK